MINIINQNEDLKQKLIDDLLKRVPGIEKTILDDLFKQLDAQDLSGGKFTSVLTADDLLKFEDIINKSLIKIKTLLILFILKQYKNKIVY